VALEVATLLLLSVHGLEVDGHAGDTEDEEELTRDRCPQPGQVGGRVDGAEDGGGEDAADGAEADLQRRTDAALRVRADVVALVREDAGYVALAAGDAEEGADVARVRVGRVGGGEQADDAHAGHHHDDRPAHAHPVGERGEREADGAGEDARRRRH